MSAPLHADNAALRQYIQRKMLTGEVSPVAARIVRERVDSGRADSLVNIFVDGDLCDVPAGTMSYADVVTLAGYEPARILSVVWHDGDTSGILTPGKSVTVAPRMRFEVADTSHA